MPQPRFLCPLRNNREVWIIGLFSRSLEPPNLFTHDVTNDFTSWPLSDIYFDPRSRIQRASGSRLIGYHMAVCCTLLETPDVLPITENALYVNRWSGKGPNSSENLCFWVPRLTVWPRKHGSAFKVFFRPQNMTPIGLDWNPSHLSLLNLTIGERQLPWTPNA